MFAFRDISPRVLSKTQKRISWFHWKVPPPPIQTYSCPPQSMHSVQSTVGSNMQISNRHQSLCTVDGTLATDSRTRFTRNIVLALSGCSTSTRSLGKKIRGLPSKTRVLTVPSPRPSKGCSKSPFCARSTAVAIVMSVSIYGPVAPVDAKLVFEWRGTRIERQLRIFLFRNLPKQVLIYP